MSVHELIVYLCAKDASAAIEYYTKAFGATERYRLTEPSGRVGHAELELGAAEFYISDEFPEMDVNAPAPDNPAKFSIHLHVDNADAFIEKAVAAGAELTRPPEDQFFGERSGAIRDPFGYNWLKKFKPEEKTAYEMWTETLSPLMTPRRARGPIYHPEHRRLAGIDDDWITVDIQHESSSRFGMYHGTNGILGTNIRIGNVQDNVRVELGTRAIF